MRRWRPPASAIAWPWLRVCWKGAASSNPPPPARPRSRSARLPTRSSPGQAAPGNEAGILEAALAVAKPAAVELGHAAAGGLDDGVTRRGVPFHGAAEARIEIGLAGGQDAEFDGAAGALDLAHPVVLQQRIQVPARMPAASD